MRYGIGEWYGRPFTALAVAERLRLARMALGEGNPDPCPFGDGRTPCRKPGGVCSLQRYPMDPDGRSGSPVGDPVIVCPSRFEENLLPARWLAEIAGFSPGDARIAREVPFMSGIGTGKPAGKIDIVVARSDPEGLQWFGLEVQAVYFSGKGMRSQFELLRNDASADPGRTVLSPEPSPSDRPPFPDEVRRPDWRSSGAKRLMPQLQIKAPTLRRWGSKIAVAIDRPFFNAVGGPSPNFSRDPNDGDIIWLVPELRRGPNGNFKLSRGHWEVLTLERSEEKLRDAEPVRREDFEKDLVGKLGPLS